MKKSALSDIFGGLIVVAIGLSFFLAANNVISWEKWWAYLLVFLGIIFVLDAVVRNLKLQERLMGSRFIAGVILLILGFSFIFSLRNWWPLILIAAGLLIIIKGIMSSREEKKSEPPKDSFNGKNSTY
jgi:ABC-type iron transport system FetAB permease component